MKIVSTPQSRFDALNVVGMRLRCHHCQTHVELEDLKDLQLSDARVVVLTCPACGKESYMPLVDVEKWQERKGVK